MAKIYQLDAEEIERIQTNFKIPVDSTWPGTYWIVSLDRLSLMPTVEELEMIRSYCEFVVQDQYRESYRTKIMAKALPKEAGHNTVIFRKGFSVKEGAEQHWFFRMINWKEGPTYFPNTMLADYRGYSLIEIMDRIHCCVPEDWVAWKRGHALIFGLSTGGK